MEATFFLIVDLQRNTFFRRFARFFFLAGDRSRFHGENCHAGGFISIFAIIFVSRTPENNEFADHLDAGTTEFLGDFRVDGLTFFTIVRRNTNLNQLMSVQFAVDFFQNGVGQTVSAEKNDGIKVMRLRTQSKSCVACENNFFHNFNTVISAVSSGCSFDRESGKESGINERLSGELCQ
ncbi:hypothetical protein EVA_12414 [gut metagenome]|uniref:Uncharacterized protein n=1 Tax=gut metagenome TaxID=749906 RepID=J9FY43_9ZZZZ